MGAQWTAVAGADCVGPFTVADADTEEKQSCNVMVVPPDTRICSYCDGTPIYDSLRDVELVVPPGCSRQ
jgi:hypothetical protein